MGLLQQSRAVRQLVAGWRRPRVRLRWKVPRQQGSYSVDPGKGAGFVPAGPKVFFHDLADRLPLGLAYPFCEAAVRDDFHVSIRKLDINEYTVILLRVPHLELSEHFQRASARRYLVDHLQRRQRGFNGKANFAGVSTFGRSDGALDGVQRGFRE